MLNAGAAPRAFLEVLLSLLLGCWGPNKGRAGSQPDHAFPETDGYDRSPKDTKAAAFEFTRTVAEAAGQARTRQQDGSGP